MSKKALIPICTLLYVVATAGCMTMSTPASHLSENGNSLSHQYGEEVLAYMMQVVMGQAGDPENRDKWRSRGLDQTFNIAHISNIMSDPGANKTAIMVNDPNILGLSKVLYHYAPEMSQFTGSYGTSLYPATELVALRLFLLRRLRDNRKISIQALLNHRQLLTAPDRLPTGQELAATNLTREETTLLQTAFEAKPWLFDSLTNPFLVAAFAKTGILEKDRVTEKMLARARYRGIHCDPPEKTPGRDALVVAFLPSLTSEFIMTDSGFKPSTIYTAAVESLKKGILAACRGADEATDPKEKKHRDKVLSEKVFFQTLSLRPLVIYPGNAAQVIRQTCSRADFVVILLGKNVYQAMHIDPARDTYPAVNRIYLDITEVKYARVASEVAEIGRFLYKKLHPGLAGMAAGDA